MDLLLLHRLSWPSKTLLFRKTLLLLLVHWSAQASITPGMSFPVSLVDQQALMSFKSLLIDYNALGSWNESVPLCQWAGVRCNTDHRVVSLDLCCLNLTGAISPSLANLTSLARLNISNNTLHGPIPRELGSMPRLTEIYLDLNELEGKIPETLGQLSKLEILLLNHNKLQGKIPTSLTNCSKLNALLLENNNLTGSIPPSLGNLSMITWINLGFNNLDGEIPVELGNLPLLQVLDLRSNKIVGKVPPKIYNISSLEGIGFGSNRLVGTLPADFGRYLPSLVFADMYDNNFEGPIPSSIINARGLKRIQFHQNKFVGQVPPNLGLLASLHVLYLNDNLLEGGLDFLISLTNCANLSDLDLSNNKFSGNLPQSLGNLSPKLQRLGLSRNPILGEIPISVGNLTGLVDIELEYNQLAGPIPDTIGNLRNLNVLAFSGNMLSGEIPSSLGGLTNLGELYLSNNNFSGCIPSNFASLKMLRVFDISHNNLDGTISGGVLSITSLTIFLNLSYNSFVGELPNEVEHLVNLAALDVSYNKLSGEIPSGLGSCEVLQYLNLQANSFSGNIPDSLMNLKGIQMLDLSQNQLSGLIPNFLSTLSSLQFLNLSLNNFDGHVPLSGIFSNSSSFSIAGNKDICGGIRSLNLKPCSTKKSSLSMKEKIIIIVIALLAVVSLFVLMLILVRRFQDIRCLKKSNISTRSLEKQFDKVSYSDLKRATNDFSPSNLIGMGAFGSVYKGFLEQDNMEVAVKVLTGRIHATWKSFITECNILRNVRHRNLIRILTSCSIVDANGNDFRALVYEFMPNGNLHMWLHKKIQSKTTTGIGILSLNLHQRLNIAIDIASALDYLHNQIEIPIVHRDLKPSNVLLDHDLTAHVGDFGIAKFLPISEMEQSTSTAGVEGSIGYMAPECGSGAPVSTMWDVYSFGIMLLEIFTGKRPTDECLTDSLNLHKYVQRSFPHNIQDIIYPELLLEVNGGDMNHKTWECLVSVIGIGLVCSNDLPRNRMKINEALKKLEDIKWVLTTRGA